MQFLLYDMIIIVIKFKNIIGNTHTRIIGTTST